MSNAQALKLALRTTLAALITFTVGHLLELPQAYWAVLTSVFVVQASVGGSLKRELSVLLRAEKLREYNVSISEVVNALRNQNTTAPVGKIRGTLDEQSIRLVGQ